MEQVGGDREVIDQVADTTGCRVVSPNSPQEARSLMAGARTCVSSRLHGGVFALQSGCPVAFLEYLPKTTGVLTVAGIDVDVFPIDSFDANDVVTALESRLETGAPIIDLTAESPDSFTPLWQSLVGGPL